MRTRRTIGTWIVSLALVFGWTLAGEAASPAAESRAAILDCVLANPTLGIVTRADRPARVVPAKTMSPTPRYRAERSESWPVACLNESSVHLSPRSPPPSFC